MAPIPQGDDRDVVPDYSDMIIVGPRIVRCFSDLMTLVLGCFCFVLPIFLILLYTHSWASDADIAAARCHRELGPITGNDAHCIGFLDIISTESDKYIINDRNYSASVGQLCPLSMLCVSSNAESIFLPSRGAAALDPETFPYTVSPPVRSFLAKPSNETLRYEPYCASWGGNIPTPLGWLLFQAFVSTIITIIVNSITNVPSVADCIAKATACVSMTKFKVFSIPRKIKNCCLRCCCCCCKEGDDDDNGDGSDATAYREADDATSAMITIENKKKKKESDLTKKEEEEKEGAAAGREKTNEELDAEAEEVYRTELEEARDKRMSLLRRKDWVERCFLVGTPQCMLAWLSLAFGVYAAVTFMMSSVPSAPEEISSFERMGWYYVNIFGGSATSAFVSFGTTLFVHLNSKHWTFYDAKIYDLPCCGLFAPYRLLYATVSCAREFVYDMFAPMWLFLSRVLRCCKFDKKDEAFLTIGSYFLVAFLFVSSVGWYTHVLVGFWFYFIPIMLLVGSGLFVLACPVFGLTVMTAWWRVESTVTLPATGILAPVYKKDSLVAVFHFFRLCSTQLFYSYVGYFLWSLSTNMAQNMYINQDLTSGEGYKGAIFIELSRRSQSCYMMKTYTSGVHGVNSVMSLL